MALVKMYRDIPEVAGGATEAMIPEDPLEEGMATHSSVLTGDSMDRGAW